MKQIPTTYFFSTAGALGAFMGCLCGSYARADISAKNTNINLESAPQMEAFKDAKEELITLVAQPMVLPRPAQTTTDSLTVKAIHNKKWLSFYIRWNDPERSDAGKLGTYSDAVALQFPVVDHTQPPPIFMGAKSNPVHIYHWRAQYQLDKDKGMRTMKDLYPNMTVDMYPMEFPDMGNLLQVDDTKREIYSYGKAAGNPQSYVKKGVDEILAEGYGSSSVVENILADASAEWKNGQWHVVISRPISREGASILPESGTFVSFAIWQGGKDEVGSRKSVTMVWTPLKFE